MSFPDEEPPDVGQPLREERTFPGKGRTDAGRSDLRLVLEITNAVRESWSAVPPEMVAATILAKYHRKKHDLVMIQNGLCLSWECWVWISSLEVWVSEDGEIFVTQRGLPVPQDEAVKDSAVKLREKLPGSENHGGIPVMAYITALAFEIGIHPRRILTNPDTGDVRVTTERHCSICGDPTPKSMVFLVQKESAGRFVVRDFCSDKCRVKWVQRHVASGTCAWCGGRLNPKSYQKGNLGDIYCDDGCLNSAHNVITFMKTPDGTPFSTPSGIQ
jgi:hypothetical protein